MNSKAANLLTFGLPVAVGITINTTLSQFFGGGAIALAIAVQTILWIILRRHFLKIQGGNFGKPQREEKPFDSGRFGFAGLFRNGTPLPFVCLGCHFPHNKIQCPKCGSRMKKLSN